MTEVAAPPQPRRGRAVRWLLRLGIGVLALAVVLSVVLLWMNHRSSQSLVDAIAETNLVDPAWRIGDVEAARTAVADDQNAALAILALVKQLPAGGPFASIAIGGATSNMALHAAQRKSLEEELAPKADFLKAARDLAEYSTGRFPIIYSPSFLGTKTHLEQVLQARNFLYGDLLVRIDAGDVAAAARAWHAFYVISQAIGDEPLIDSQKWRTNQRQMAIAFLERLLAQVALDDATLASIQSRLEADEPAPLALFALLGERAGSFDLFEGFKTGAAQKSTWDALERSVRNVATGHLTVSESLAMMPGSLPGQQAASLRFMNRVIAVVRQPVENWGPQLAALKSEIVELPVLARMMVGAVVKTGESFRGSHAEMRCAIAAVAAERFRQSTGRWPATLQDLANAGLLTAILLDPFDGEPLRLKRTAFGLVVYSVGADGVDDGGDVTRQSSGAPSRDLGIRLWDVNKRKLPSVGEP